MFERSRHNSCLLHCFNFQTDAVSAFSLTQVARMCRITNCMLKAAWVMVQHSYRNQSTHSLCLHVNWVTVLIIVQENFSFNTLFFDCLLHQPDSCGSESGKKILIKNNLIRIWDFPKWSLSPVYSIGCSYFKQHLLELFVLFVMSSFLVK